MSGSSSFEAIRAEAERTVSQLPLDVFATLDILLPVDAYYLLGTYPPLKAMAPIDAADALAGLTDECNVYVHIPFCDQRCTFCHFAKEVLPSRERVQRYLSALWADLDAVAATVARTPRASTLYVGGGTPSFLDAHQTRLLFGKVREYVDVPDGAEWTFELHPNIIEAPDHAERIDAALECGANRMVFGVQSMDERVLRKLNRGHTGDDVLTLLDLLWSRGVRNVSVDLMFGLPYQTPENWHLTLRTLLDAGVEKFNIFPLMFKQADPISGHRRRSPDIFADGRDRLVMHHMAELMLAEAGFRRGPIFYYSLDPVHSAQQVSKYESIEDVNLLPFGVSGFGFVGQTQFYNHCSLADYIAAAEAGRAPVWVGAELSLDERRRRAVMFSLRSHGVDRLEYEQRYGVDPVDYFAAELVPFVDENLVAVTDDALTLTDRGAPFADSVALRLASDAVKRAVRATNDVIVDPRRDPRDRYDFSPIGRGPIGVGSGEG